MSVPSSIPQLRSGLFLIKETLCHRSNEPRHRDKIQMDLCLVSMKTLEVCLERRSSISYARGHLNPRRSAMTHADCDVVDVLPMVGCCGRLEVLADMLQPIAMQISRILKYKRSLNENLFRCFYA